MGKTSIPYVHYSFSPWQGCSRISEGCANCFAEAIDRRFGGGIHWGLRAPRAMQSDAYWDQPLGWNRAAKRAGERRRVLCASMCDPCEPLNELDESRARLGALIRLTTNLTWLILTKRPGRYDLLGDVPTLPNVIIGTTIESQGVDWRLDELLSHRATARWVSVEPMLGPVSLAGRGLDELELVVVGDEDGVKRRPAELDWVRALRDECMSLARPPHFFFKQWHFDGRKTNCPSLDGRRWVEVPE